MATFKVKYRTRQRLQRAIQQEISLLGLIDDGTMKRSIRISSVAGTLGNIVITVNAIYYYVFQDLGANGAGSSGNVYIRANDITARALKSSQGQKFIEEVYQAYVDFIDENYGILDTSKLVLEKFVLTYELFGATGKEEKYNGFYDPNINLRV